VTSDSLDVRGPIPLTRAGVQARPVLSLTFVLYNLSAVNIWHPPCARATFCFVFEVLRTPPIRG
jgi:hypothetical protein